MKSVFFGGSRRLSRLSPELTDRLDNIIARGFRVLVGDANGADRAVQSYLAQRGYRDVVVYCTGGRCRNNVGGWPVKSIASPGTPGTFAFYAAKDDAMIQDAEYGLFLWDGTSRGTVRNIIRMAGEGKASAVYLSPQRQFLNVRSMSDVPALREVASGDALSFLDETLNTLYPVERRAAN